MEKRMIHNYMPIREYYNKLMITLFILSSILSLFIIQYIKTNAITFILFTFIIIFLIISITTLIEFFEVSDYMDPFETYDVKNFLGDFLEHSKEDRGYLSEHINKYDSKSKSNLKDKIVSSNSYDINKIRKDKDTYHATVYIYKNKKASLLNKKIRLNIKRVGDKLKIVRAY